MLEIHAGRFLAHMRSLISLRIPALSRKPDAESGVVVASLTWSDKNGSDACALPFHKISGVGSVHCTVEKQPYQHDDRGTLVHRRNLPRQLGVKLCMEDVQMEELRIPTPESQGASGA